MGQVLDDFSGSGKGQGNSFKVGVGFLFEGYGFWSGSSFAPQNSI